MNYPARKLVIVQHELTRALSDTLFVKLLIQRGLEDCRRVRGMANLIY